MQKYGYACYLAAFARYRNTKPLSAEKFANGVRDQADGPFERWGVFVGENLAGFAICCVEDGYAALHILKLHPDFLAHYPAYALIDTLLQHYVAAAGKVLTNGYRAINHDTEFQDFLLKFGFSRHYCDLKVVYRPEIDLFVRAAYPFRKMLNALPRLKYTDAARALLFQESVCRSFR
jgi:hypothetical protein